MKVYNEFLSGSLYAEFLGGREYYPGMENISFDDVTLNLADFHNGDHMTFRNGKTYDEFSPKSMHKDPILTFVGETYVGFSKCYGFKLLNQTVTFGFFTFNMSLISNLSKRNIATFIRNCI